MYRNLCLTLLAGIVVLNCRTASAQHSHVQSASDGGVQLSVVTDGSKTPDQIPDDLAYQHFFMATAAHQPPTAGEQARQAVQLFHLQLSSADQQTLIQGLAKFRAQLDQIENALGQLAKLSTDPATPVQIAGLRQQEVSLSSATLSSLRQTMTQDGAARLDGYVRTHVKAHIVILGGPM